MLAYFLLEILVVLSGEFRQSRIDEVVIGPNILEIFLALVHLSQCFACMLPYSLNLLIGLGHVPADHQALQIHFILY